MAAVVRRAGSGERLVITVDGQPVAQLGPIEPTGSPTLHDLAAAGLIRLPGRTDRADPPAPASLPIDSRPGRVVAELRGDTTGRTRR